MGGFAQRDVVAVLTRAPSAGGKSRLFAELGVPPDSSLLAALLLDTLDAVSVRPPSREHCEDMIRVVAVEPPSACEEVRAMVPSDVLVIPQPDGTLGDRMAGVMRVALDAGARAVALIGSDVPAVSAAVLARAFALLRDDPRRVVLGPALDGGYYLIAASQVPDLFRDIEWSSARVLEQTRDAAFRAGLDVELVDTSRDIDTLPDLIAWIAGVESSPDAWRSRTRAWARAQGIPRGNAR